MYLQITKMSLACAHLCDLVCEKSDVRCGELMIRTNGRLLGPSDNTELDVHDSVEAVLTAKPRTVVVTVLHHTVMDEGAVGNELHRVLRTAAATATEFHVKTRSGGGHMKVNHLVEWMVATPGGSLNIDKVVAYSHGWHEDYARFLLAEGDRLCIDEMYLEAHHGDAKVGKALEALLRSGARFNTVVFFSAIKALPDEYGKEIRAALAVANIGCLRVLGGPDCVPSKAENIEHVVWNCIKGPAEWTDVMPLKYARLRKFDLFLSVDGVWARKDVNVVKRRDR